ncbi:acyltransferase family protein [Roseateles cavernae]|uniref:acyltransferase family protein n=1 Tax=Roseateles cavernae TaxID=3153578 RepID=UPI0032E478BF
MMKAPPLFGQSRLADFTSGRDNNFNLIRFLAATLVLVSHSFALSTGRADLEPFRTQLGLSLGDMAVCVFFAASGFLVTGSLLSRQSLKEFVLSRALRIYPGLWAALLLTVIFTGLCISTVSLMEFFATPLTWKYLANNALMLRSVEHFLPATFQDIPWPRAVNGSLWTLPLELRMYLVLAGLWLLAGLLRLRNAPNFIRFCCLVLAVAGFAYSASMADPWAHGGRFFLLGGFFFTGAALRAFQGRIPMSATLAWFALLALIATALMGGRIFCLGYALLMPYLVLAAAYLPDGGLRVFNRFGDYSYGIYIYAFFVQQACVHFFPGMGPYVLMLLSFAVTLLLAICSWHAIESRAMGLKAHLIGMARGASAESRQLA